MSMSRYCDIFLRELITVACQDSEFEGLQFGRFEDCVFPDVFEIESVSKTITTPGSSKY